MFANFCVLMLKHNALQHLLFFFFIFLHFLNEMVKVFSASAQHFASWKVVIQDRDCFLGHTWKFTFVDSVNFCPRWDGQLKYKQTLKHTRKMHATVQQTNEREISMEAKNAVISQRFIWFVRRIYYESLISTVLWISCRNLHLMWNKNIVSLLYKFLKVCCKPIPHFMYVLKIVHSSPGSHDKVIYMNFFVIPTSLSKFESSVHDRNWDIKSGPHFVFRL